MLDKTNRESNLENAKAQKAGCEMKRQGLTFKMKFYSTYNLKDAIAPILYKKRNSTTSNNSISKVVPLSLLIPCEQIQPPVTVNFLLTRLSTKDFM